MLSYVSDSTWRTMMQLSDEFRICNYEIITLRLSNYCVNIGLHKIYNSTKYIYAGWNFRQLLITTTVSSIVTNTSILLKMLGVTITNHMSASEHVSDVISRCAQSYPCCENITKQWHEWWYPASHLQNSYPLEAIIRVQCLVGICERCRSSAVGSICSSRCAEWFLQC